MVLCTLIFPSRGYRTWASEKSSLFQQCLFTLHSNKNFEYIILHYFTCITQSMFSKIKTNVWSFLLYFLVSQVLLKRLINLERLKKTLLPLYISICNWKWKQSKIYPQLRTATIYGKHKFPNIIITKNSIFCCQTFQLIHRAPS